MNTDKNKLQAWQEVRAVWRKVNASLDRLELILGVKILMTRWSF